MIEYRQYKGGDVLRRVKTRLIEVYGNVLDTLQVGELKDYYSVLMPLGLMPNGSVALMLNKRSRFVPQPGDLCFPGGGQEHPMDTLLGMILRACHPWFVENAGSKSTLLALLACTAIREAWEELRLNPIKLSLLGILYPQSLVTFRKKIVPFVGWIRTPVSIRPNGREVQKVVWIPLEELFRSEQYALFRLYDFPNCNAQDGLDFPCFLHQDGVSVEILWGATYRIVMDFLHIMWDFVPPDIESRLIVPGMLDKRYLSGYET